MSFRRLPFSNPFIHTPPKFLFTKRRSTFWEPDPIHIDESNFDALAELQAQGIDVASINYSTSGPTADSGSDLPNFMLDMQRWAHEYGFNQTSVHILGSYSSNDGVGY